MSKVAIEPGAMLLHYRLIDRLGAGGMGVVWKAFDTTLDREVAIKFLPPDVAGDPDRLLRFEREAKLLASLNHPNIAAIYGLHEDHGVRFLAMELIRGKTLGGEIAAGMSPQRVLDRATAIAEGLAAAHEQRVIHRDLKPDNIMIDASGRLKILDFGLAKSAAETLPPDAETRVRQGDSREPTPTRQGTVIGTAAYMSPEQAQGHPVDPRSDIFSFGIVLYEMVTGRRPFTGDNAVALLSSILRDTPAPVSPSSLDRVIRRCLEKDPAKRYPDAAALRDDLLALRAPSSAPRRRPPIALALLALIALAVLLVFIAKRHARQQWVQKEAIPRLQAIADRVQALEEGRDSWDAFVLARRIDEVAPGNPIVAQLRPKFERQVTIESDPPGALVTARYYDEPDAPPIVLGKTPLRDVSFARGFTRLHLELPGRRPAEDLVWNFALAGNRWTYRLPKPHEIPDEMVDVPPGAFELYIPGLDHLKKEPMTEFLIDRTEVTNREYKRFVDAGGYDDPKYWQQRFVDGSRTLTREEAMRRFVDRTGQRGPAGWELGTYAEGHGEDPVSGVSWFEAAAYAAWAGKSLPTVFHWNRVAFTVASSRIIPLANLSGKGPIPAAAGKSANRFGTLNLAGNVREWVWNSTDGGRGRYILGGGWTDPDWAFSDAYAQPAFDRSLTNGFRCIRILGNEPNLAALQRTLDRPSRDYFAEKPVSDAEFAQFLRLFTYDRLPLDAKIEEDKEIPLGRRQKITFNAAYGGERMMAYLFLPSSAKPPYQVVVTFPGSGAIDARSSAALEPGRLDFVVKTGRALLWPIYKGTYERGGDLHSDYPNETNAYKDYVVMWGKDLERSLDYVETRPDLDAHRIAYYGLSWGGALGAILPAIEPRIRTNLLYVAGLQFQRALPEVEAINYVGRVRQPTLILNGELDFFFPPESQRAMFELLGTPRDQKKRLVFPGGHSVPRTEMIRESLSWLDRTLGPVTMNASRRQ